MSRGASKERKIEIPIIPPSENTPLNYSKYIASTLHSISLLTPAIKQEIYNNRLVSNFNSNPASSRNLENPRKKLILLDLDETLVHSDFDLLYPGTYDTTVTFEDTLTKEKISVGVYFRKDLEQFLRTMKSFFELAIFTSSVKEYADAIIDSFDKSNEFFSFRLYRESCIYLNNVYIKDLNVVSEYGYELKDVVLVDNSLYSFAGQINNGILISSFYDSKDDCELGRVCNYLIGYIENSEDVRKQNKNFFGFSELLKQFQSRTFI